MHRPVLIGVTFAGGFALCTVMVLIFDSPLRDWFSPPAPATAPQRPVRVVPRPIPTGEKAIDRHTIAILEWLLDHRPDSANLEFITWGQPSQVQDNPYTREPATMLHVHLQSNKSKQAQEQLVFFLKDGKVIGCGPQESFSASARVQ